MLPTPFWNQNYTIRSALKYVFLHMILSIKTINIMFYKTKNSLNYSNKNNCIYIIYIHLNVLYENHMIWSEINGHMSYDLFKINCLYRFCTVNQWFIFISIKVRIFKCANKTYFISSLYMSQCYFQIS